MDKIRINKHLANLGVASRRKIDSFIDQKRITINGVLAKNGDKINPVVDQISVDGRPISHQVQKLEYIMLHKPLHVISSASDNQGRQTVLDLVQSGQRLYPVGRLDYLSTGLLLLTNDGDLAYKLTHPKFHFPKVYLVRVQGQPSPQQLDLLKTGVPLEDGITAPSDVKVFQKLGTQTILKITLLQGKNRQIRRMCQAVDLPLLSLHRIAIGPISLGNLGVGEWRYLSANEFNQL